MKIAVSAIEGNPEAQIDPRLGRCQHFVFYDTETKQFEGTENPNIYLSHGAGVQTGQYLANQNVSVVITGNAGPKAFSVLAAAGIKVITGVTGRVREAVESFERGELEFTPDATVPDHFGLGGGPGGGVGMGRGGGMGMGRGGGGRWRS